MNSVFATGFQRNFFMGAPPPARLGTPLSAAEIDEITRLITQGRQKLAQVRAWIASRIDADPMLSRTFNNPVVERNFWDYFDLINRDQYDVDVVWNMIQNPTSAEYDIPDEHLRRTDDWSRAVDIVHGAMQEYGRPAAAVPPGAKPPTPVQRALTQPPPSSGLSKGEILAGGALVAALGVVLVMALK